LFNVDRYMIDHGTVAVLLDEVLRMYDKIQSFLFPEGQKYGTKPCDVRKGHSLTDLL